MRNAVAVVLVAVLLGGCTSSSTNATSQSQATSTEFPQVSQSEAISLTLAGFPQQDFNSVRIVASTDKKSVAPLLLHATMNVDSRTSGATTRGLWEACLADGAIAEHLAGDATNLEQVIVGVHIQARFPDGSTEEEGGCGGTIKPGALYTAQAQGLSDAEIVNSVDAVLARYGLTPVNVDVLHPLGPAVSVVASVPDVDSVKGQFAGIEAAILGDPYRYDGIYLELRGPDGSPLTGAWNALRAGTGGYWSIPGMDGALGILHGGLAPMRPPAEASCYEEPFTLRVGSRSLTLDENHSKHVTMHLGDEAVLTATKAVNSTCIKPMFGLSSHKSLVLQGPRSKFPWTFVATAPGKPTLVAASRITCPPGASCPLPQVATVTVRVTGH